MSEAAALDVAVHSVVADSQAFRGSQHSSDPALDLPPYRGHIPPVVGEPESTAPRAAEHAVNMSMRCIANPLRPPLA